MNDTIKKKLPIIIALALVAVGIIGIILYFVLRYDYPFDGEGTKSEPYLISASSDLVDFMEMSDKISSDFGGKYFKLTADIDLNGIAWTPVCHSGKAFGGSFDGDGHTIKNFSIAAKGENVGFFSGTTNSFADSGIFNLRLESVALSLNQDVRNVGVLVGNSNSVIVNCYVDATMEISGLFDHLGGIAGWSGAEIRDCESNGTMRIAAYERTAAQRYQWPNIGAIAGSSIKSITDSVNRLQIEMTKAVNNGQMSRSHHVGGIVGSGVGALYRNLKNYAKLQAVGALGGIMGTINSSGAIVEDCYNYGDLYSTSDVLLDVGGIVGRSFQNVSPEVRNCYNGGDVTAVSLLKPLETDGSQTIISCWAGGILGLGQVNITNCATVGNINMSGVTTHYAGGIVGGLAGRVKNSYNRGNVSVYSENGSVITGGVVGVLQSGESIGVFSSYNSGSVVLGLGQESISPIRNYLVGGVIGYNMNENNPIQKNYFDADIVNAFQAPEGFLSAKYWYGEEIPGEAENISSSGIYGNDGLSTVSLQSSLPAGFTQYNAESSDPDAVWVLEAGQYPRLYWEV